MTWKVNVRTRMLMTENSGQLIFKYVGHHTVTLLLVFNFLNFYIVVFAANYKSGFW